jgi:DNA mismatch repair protein MSH6
VIHNYFVNCMCHRVLASIKNYLTVTLHLYGCVAWSSNVYVNFCSNQGHEQEGLCKKDAVDQHFKKGDVVNSNGKVGQGRVVHIESDDDLPGPETPGMQPLVPRLKRFKEDSPKFGVKNDSSLSDSSKRLKLLQDSTALNKNHKEVSDTMSKFEWLDPTRIRDANGRRPGDPLYDKKTLYIPPDILRKMSASQKQYWSVKSQYMDVVVFFKVVSYCFIES